MKVCMTFEFDDEVRKAISYHHGDKGKATRARIRALIEDLVTAWRDDLASEYYEGRNIK
jgi:non-homologous end joining protein Ku